MFLNLNEVLMESMKMIHDTARYPIKIKCIIDSNYYSTQGITIGIFDQQKMTLVHTLDVIP